MRSRRPTDDSQPPPAYMARDDGYKWDAEAEQYFEDRFRPRQPWRRNVRGWPAGDRRWFVAYKGRPLVDQMGPAGQGEPKVYLPGPRRLNMDDPYPAAPAQDSRPAPPRAVIKKRPQDTVDAAAAQADKSGSQLR